MGTVYDPSAKQYKDTDTPRTSFLNTTWVPHMISLLAKKCNTKQDRGTQYVTCCQWDMARGQW